MVLSASIVDVPHRRFVAWGWVVGTAAVVALVVGSVGVATSVQPQPSASARPTPSLDASAAEGFAAAKHITGATWDQVDASWDVLAVTASYGISTPRVTGTVGVYLTPPGGERRLATIRTGLEDSTLRGLAWDPQSRTLLLTNTAGEFGVLDMQTGEYASLEPPIAGGIARVVALGRASDGRSYLSVTPAPEDTRPSRIVAWDGGGWAPIAGAEFGAVSTLNGDTAIVWRDGSVLAYDVVTGATSAPLAVPDGCWFASWATPTDFSAQCYEGQDLPLDVIGVSVARGTAAPLGQVPPGGSLLEPGTSGAVAGTPIVLSQAGGDITVAVLTLSGTHVAGTMPFDSVPWAVVRAADSRWLLMGDSHFPYVVDAKRGTLESLGDGFNLTPQGVSFLPGVRD